MTSHTSPSAADTTASPRFTPESDHTKQPNPTPARGTARHLWWRALKWVGIFLSIFIGATVLVVTLIGWWYLDQFSAAAGVEPTQLYQTATRGWSHHLTTHQGRQYWLMYGVDTLTTRGDIPPLTDTIILVSINLDNQEINLVSLPRDIWSPEYQTKINALLAYGQDRNPANPTAFPDEVMSELTGVPIDHSLVVSLNQLAELIDLLGGVEVTIEDSFTDDQFPRPDVDVTTVTDPDLLYKTVSFTAGTEVMDGQRALEYIRSRKASGQTGTDLSRAARQQAVIKAIINQLTQPATLTNPKLTGQLYRYYLDTFQAAVPEPTLIALAKALILDGATMQLNPHQLAVYPDDPTGTIEHPPQALSPFNLWIYQIRDRDQFQAEICRKLECHLKVHSN